MDRLIGAAALGVVLATALFLVALGVAALALPAVAKRFLGGFATTRTLHFVELTLRVVVGVAFVQSAQALAFDSIARGFGWVLIATSIALAFIPWRMHQRFAAWSVPRATTQLPLIGVASLAGGIAIIAAICLPST